MIWMVSSSLAQTRISWPSLSDGDAARALTDRNGVYGFHLVKVDHAKRVIPLIRYISHIGGRQARGPSGSNVHAIDRKAEGWIIVCTAFPAGQNLACRVR